MLATYSLKISNEVTNRSGKYKSESRNHQYHIDKNNSINKADQYFNQGENGTFDNKNENNNIMKNKWAR